MVFLNLIGKGVLGGAIIVGGSELAKRTTVFGALLVSLPLTSIITLSMLYRETKDTAKVADLSESILWLIIPSMLLFIILPVMLRRGYGFEISMATGIAVTILAYGLGIWAAQSMGNLS
ncbi:MAG: DUF3147 family protein [Candidatus Poseidoniales archaeon]|jgi:hypothetical protein|tara:strand:- start:851 stop:1207 length:357 start_codon:yes stop_codon:yes gene_type:complete